MGFPVIGDIARRVDVLKARYADRDRRHELVRAVRAGETDMAFPGMFPSQWPKPIVANFIDVVARDLAEISAPLPSFSCGTSKTMDESSRSRADKRTRIANHYVEASRLGTQMFLGMDYYYTYGFTAYWVEPNFDESRPHIRVEDSYGSYPEFDRWGNVTGFAKRFLQREYELVGLFPEAARKLMGPFRNEPGSTMHEVIRWTDDERTVLFLPGASRNASEGPTVLAEYVNPLGRCPVVIAGRPDINGDQHGQFDDVIWVQLARSRFAILSLQAAQDSVEAPIALPNDIQEFAMGGQSVLRSQFPEKIRRVPLDLPSNVFAQEAMLLDEMRSGSRYPEGRSGTIDASIVTGRGVQALMGGFDTQVRSAQQVHSEALRDVIAMCYELDEKLWPDAKRDVRGNDNGTPYSISYTPIKDIKGDYSIDVTYGLMAGLDPNRALVWGLQARGDKLISRDFLRRNLPVPINPSDEERRIDVEDMRDALKQGVAGYIQSLPLMAQQGQDPAQIIRVVTAVVQGRKRGRPIEDLLEEAFEPPEQEMDDQGAGEGEPEMDGGPPAPGGLDQSGRMPGVAPGQQGMGPGGRPDMRQLLTSLSGNGQPRMSASVLKRQPIG